MVSRLENEAKISSEPSRQTALRQKLGKFPEAGIAAKGALWQQAFLLLFRRKKEKKNLSKALKNKHTALHSSAENRPLGQT